MNGRTKTKLANLLARRFSMSELESLVFSLDDVDFENLEGKTKKAKVEALVAYMERRGRTNELLKQIEVERSDLAIEIAKLRKGNSKSQVNTIRKRPEWIIILGAVLLILILAFVGWKKWGQGELSVSQERFLFQVRILDDVTNTGVENAKVTLDLPGTVPISTFTDSTGLGVFEIEPQYSEKLVGLHVVKPGYENWDQNIKLEKEQRPYEVRLSQ